MIYKILTVFLVVIFYIIRMPIVIIKDIILAFYSPFDVSRFLECYQNTLANLVCISSVIKKTKEHDLNLDESNNSAENNSIGFKSCPTGLETPQSPSEAGYIE